MARMLIVYGTREGQTARIAERIASVARVARDGGHQVALLDIRQAPRDLALIGYDMVVIGASVRAGAYPKAIKAFVQAHMIELARLPSVFFSVSLAAASADPAERAEAERLARAFVAETGWQPTRLVCFAGALPYTKYNWLVRWLLRRISAQHGGDTDTSRDYEYTDWVAVEHFAAELLASGVPVAVASA